MQSAELIKNNISDGLPGEAVTNKTLSPQPAGEKKINAPGRDLFEDDLYVWTLLLIDKETFRETDR
jgi:hypothetical protein